MKHLLTLALTAIVLALPAIAPVPAPEALPGADTTAADLAFAHTVSQEAAIGPGQLEPGCMDHYGDPARFTQYIIAIPPVLA